MFLDTAQVKATDSGWVIFSLRREMARQGVLLVDDKKLAQTLVEAAVAAYGTDEVDCRFSLPSTFSVGVLPVPTGTADAGGLIRKNRQDAVVKLALLAFDARSRRADLGIPHGDGVRVSRPPLFRDDQPDPPELRAGARSVSAAPHQVASSIDNFCAKQPLCLTKEPQSPGSKPPATRDVVSLSEAGGPAEVEDPR